MVVARVSFLPVLREVVKRPPVVTGCAEHTWDPLPAAGVETMCQSRGCWCISRWELDPFDWRPTVEYGDDGETWTGSSRPLGQ